MVNIVTIGDSRYILDVGFGSNYVPVSPIRLIHDTTGMQNVAPASVRLIFKSLENTSAKYQKLWVYQHRISADSEFKDMYCFTDTEFFPRDFEMMNYWTSTSAKAIFTQRVICNKMVLGDGDGEIVGTLTLQGDLKKRIGTKTDRLLEFGTEEERLKALDEHFGITFSEAERDGIRGSASEIK
jgi:arylamine N-acetyltransferase